MKAQSTALNERVMSSATLNVSPHKAATQAIAKLRIDPFVSGWTFPLPPNCSFPA